jgi:hypothetical protein
MSCWSWDAGQQQDRDVLHYALLREVADTRWQLGTGTTIQGKGLTTGG